MVYFIERLAFQKQNQKKVIMLILYSKMTRTFYEMTFKNRATKQAILKINK